jgi:hypothetical protein
LGIKTVCTRNATEPKGADRFAFASVESTILGHARDVALVVDEVFRRAT